MRRWGRDSCQKAAEPGADIPGGEAEPDEPAEPERAEEPLLPATRPILDSSMPKLYLAGFKGGCGLAASEHLEHGMEHLEHLACRQKNKT